MMNVRAVVNDAFPICSVYTVLLTDLFPEDNVKKHLDIETGYQRSAFEAASQKDFIETIPHALSIDTTTPSSRRIGVLAITRRCAARRL